MTWLGLIWFGLLPGYLLSVVVTGDWLPWRGGQD